MHHAPARIVLITGGSRGIGAEVAQQLADADTHVIVNYRKTAARAEAIAEAIRSAGGNASTIGADISDQTECAAMIDTIAARFGRLDALILNASVSVELGAHPGYAMRRNRDAQRRVALLAVPLMPAGGHIVFVTSHQAHFFPHKAVPKGYTAIAASKQAGEATLHAMRAQFHRAGVHFTVVSGEDSDGHFAEAIVNAARNPNPSGTVCVGGPRHLLSA
ncbi:SDR family oxidoreductase [Mycobacterium deserti]|uniref:SDR family oxidoreductase n=1 Tax=Mycobacterium deserti TaxID=2978347 RepID=A0ABT2M5G1_9MYCO|nr:SDR family oxidoreductase [Mycobacterium deserti]MCT7657482.1 SDR family oxidoreductase [Mycobacterium deserti]